MSGCLGETTGKYTRFAAARAAISCPRILEDIQWLAVPSSSCPPYTILSPLLLENRHLISITWFSTTKRKSGLALALDQILWWRLLHLH